MAVINEAAIRELAGIRGEAAPITSCYLDVDGRRLVRHQDVEHELETVLRDARDRANGHRSVHDDLSASRPSCGPASTAATPAGLAIFACSANDLWEVIELPLPVRRSLVINQAPAVGQLESVLQEHEPIGVLLADKQRAELFVFELGELVERSELFDELPRDYDARGERERGTPANHREELAHQHLRHAARAAFDLWQTRGFHHLAIGAPDAIASELERDLHPYLRERLCGRIPVAVGASHAEVRAAAEAVERAVERRREAALVARLREAVATGGRGVAGLGPTLAALNERRVERLLVSKGYSQEGLALPGDAGRWPRSARPPGHGERWTGSTTSSRTPSRRRSPRASRSRSASATPTSTSSAASAPCCALLTRSASLAERPDVGHADPMLAIGIDVGGTKVLGVRRRLGATGRGPRRGAGPDPRRRQRAGRRPGELVAARQRRAARLGVGVPGPRRPPGRAARRRPPAAPARRADRGRARGLAPACRSPSTTTPTAPRVAEHERRGRGGRRRCAASSRSAPGIGGGIITGGRLRRGANGFAGETGPHGRRPRGPPCPCGRRGCWERFASGSGLGRLGRDAALAGRLDAAVALAGGDPEAVRGEHVTAAARAGDPDALDGPPRVRQWVALGLANLANVLDPASS